MVGICAIAHHAIPCTPCNTLGIPKIKDKKKMSSKPLPISATHSLLFNI